MATTPSPEQGRSRGLRSAFGGKRATRIAMIVGTVVLLAVVITVSAALSTPKSVSDAKKSGKILAEQYDTQAESALASGDTTNAVLYAHSALAVNPGDARAKAVIVKVGSKPASSNNGSSGSKTSDPSANTPSTHTTSTTPVVGDINSMLPTTVAGFKIEPPDTTAKDVISIADPLGAYASRMTRAQLAVHHLSSATKATKFVTVNEKKAYPSHGQSLTIKGQRAYFGTYGKNFAVIAYSKGPYVYETILTSITGNPSSLIDVAKILANAYSVP